MLPSAQMSQLVQLHPVGLMSPGGFQAIDSK